MKSFLWQTSLAFLSVSLASAEVKTPAIFGDHMVLQQNQKLPIWGWADPGEAVTVQFAGQTKSTKTDASGNWQVVLDPVPLNPNPAEFIVKSPANTLKYTDVIVGEVWLASGQSNMEFFLKNSSTGSQDVPKASNPLIHFFMVPRTDRVEPQQDVNAKWVVCSPETIGGFSAVAYYFGTDIQQSLRNPPMGLIGSYWGGTPAQSWTSLSGLEKPPAFANYVQQAKNDLDLWLKAKPDYPRLQAEYLEAKAKWEAEVKPGFDAANKEWSEQETLAKAANQTPPPRPKPSEPQPSAPLGPNPGPQHPTVIFKGMIHPLIPYAIKGVIWYQGESNTRTAMEYRELFPRMITDWREKWMQGDFPFLFVQLAGFGGANPQEDYPKLRESQLKTLSLPNTRMAVAMDIGDARDIHPKNKKAVGLRLALAAREMVYKQEVVPSGPLYSTMKIEGNKIRLNFNYTGTGLMAGLPTDAPAISKLEGFVIAGNDRNWLPADATISGKTVVVSNPTVTSPIAVRYGWANYVDCNLYNKEGLPASPFRTDDLPITVEPKPSQIAPAVQWQKECADRVAAFKDKPCDIIFIGDSITQNYCESPKNGWNLVGRAVWDKYYSKRNVLDFGVGGDSTQNALWRMGNMDIKNLRPKIAVIMLGMNNQNDTAEDIAAGVKAAVDKSKSLFPTAKTVVMSVTANGRMPDKTPAINSILKTFADNKSVFYVDLYSKMTPTGPNSWKGVGGDKVHLTEEGYELWASELEPLLKRLSGT